MKLKEALQCLEVTQQVSLMLETGAKWLSEPLGCTLRVPLGLYT